VGEANRRPARVRQIKPRADVQFALATVKVSSDPAVVQGHGHKAARAYSAGE
jgi:hypothetical protein